MPGILVILLGEMGGLTVCLIIQIIRYKKKRV